MTRPLFSLFMTCLILTACLTSRTLAEGSSAEVLFIEGSSTEGSSTEGPSIHAPRRDALAVTDSVKVDLGAHRWKHRLLFVFAPTVDAAPFAQQQSLWATRAEGFADRDLRIYTVIGMDAGTYRATPDAEGRPLTRESARRLRNRVEVSADDFAVVLVGKDGGEKRRDLAPVEADAIFETIDAMPMRQSEMRGSGNGE